MSNKRTRKVRLSSDYTIIDLFRIRIKYRYYLTLNEVTVMFGEMEVKIVYDMQTGAGVAFIPEVSSSNFDKIISIWGSKGLTSFPDICGTHVFK
jgi:hypothetical protein